MNSLASLKIVPYKEDHVPNPFPGGDLPWQIYHTVRNAIVRTCRRYGPTGPMGEVKIIEGAEEPDSGNDWPLGDPNAMYYVIDDQYNDERYLYAELYGNDPFNAKWLLSVISVLRKHKGWGLAIMNIPKSCILIFSDRLLVNGQLSRCKSAEEVIKIVGGLLKRGPKR